MSEAKSAPGHHESDLVLDPGTPDDDGMQTDGSPAPPELAPQTPLVAPAPGLAPHAALGAPSVPGMAAPAPSGSANPFSSPVLTSPDAPTLLGQPPAAASETSAPPTLPSLPDASAPAPTLDTSAPAATTPAPAARTDEAAPTLPSLPTPIAETSETNPPTAADVDQDPADAEAGQDAHPMAHLMPKNSPAGEANRRAAEIRAAQKAKSRKIKIGVAIGAVVFCAVVGPPLGKWLVHAINDAGNTSTEQTE